MSNKCSQKLLESAKKSTTDAIKTASNKAIQKIAEATRDLIGNEITDKITSISESLKELHSREFHSQNASKELYSETDENEIEIPKEKYIFPERREQIIDELRLV